MLKIKPIVPKVVDILWKNIFGTNELHTGIIKDK